MKSKRLDLQAIRGIAIIAVLLFHFFPDWFPNGYIGVDQFFVLSGYLIAMILWGKDLDRGTIGTFYYRRIKRIVPLYGLFVFLVLITMFTVFPPSNIDLNMESAQYALSFTTNLQRIQQYTVLLQLAVDVFTHTWSLAVEIQFYLLVPLMFCASKKFGSKLILVIGCGSFLYHTITDVDTAFNSVFARLWQFCIGIGSFLVVTTMDKAPDAEADADCLLEENFIEHGRSRKSKSKRDLVVFFLYFCSGCCLVQEMFPIAIPSVLLRFPVSVLTGIMIILGSRQIIWPMNSRILVYAGDISYALYLVHWPLYSYVKMEYPDDFKVLCIALFVSVCLAVFLTETYEKFYLKMKTFSVISLIGILYGLCLVVLVSHWRYVQTMNDFEVDLDMYRNITKEDVIQLNQKWNMNDLPQLRPSDCVHRDDVCEFKRSDNFSSDRPSILLFGNSYAGNAAEIFNESCNKTASRIVVFQSEACEVLIYTRSLAPCSLQATNDYLEIVKREKPDILFMLVRHFDFMNPLDANVSIKDDSLYKEALVRLNYYEQFVAKNIYVLDSMPRPDYGQLNKWFHEDMKMGKLPPNMTTLMGTTSEYARSRIHQLVKHCKKCKIIDYSPYLTVDGEYQFYDKSNGLSHFTTTFHLTPLALRKIKPLFENICRTL